MKKRLLQFLFLFFFVILFVWVGSIYWTTGKVSFNIFGDKSEIDITEANKKCIFKDIEMLDNGNFISLSNDCYVNVKLSDTTNISYVVFDIDLKNRNSSTFCQVFYGNSQEDFSTKKSASKKINSGKNIIEIQPGQYDKLRLDFTNEKGVEFSIDSVYMCEEYFPIDAIIIFAVFSFILIAISFIYVFKPSVCSSFLNRVKWTNLSVRRRAIILLFVGSTITICIVFLKLYYRDLLYIYSDIGSDTKMKYLPQYNLIADKIRNGSLSMWLPEVGYGYSIYYFSMFNPLLLLLLASSALLGTGYMPMLLVVYKLIAVLLCAYISFRYLELFTDNYYVVSIGAYIYAFNGFSMVWGQHYVFNDYPVYTILVFYFIEKYIRAKNKKIDIPIIIISFLSMIFSVYMSYMIYLPVAIYAIVRYIQINDKFSIKKFTIWILHLGLNVIIGFVGGLSIGLMQIINIFGSGRVSETETSKLTMLIEKLGHSFLKDDILGSLQRFLSANLSGIGSSHKGLANYYEEPQLFLTALFWIIVFQFVFTIHKTSFNKKQIICKWIAVVLVFFSLFNKGFLTILYAFSHENRRTTFAFFPILVVMIVVVLDNVLRKRIFSKIALIVGIIVTFVLLFYNYSFLLTTEKKLIIATSIFLVIVFAFVGLLLHYKSNFIGKSSCIILLIFAIFTNVTVELYVSTYRNGLITKELFNRNEIKENVTQEVINCIKEKDDSYYRMDKTYGVWNSLTDSFYLGYYPVSTYNSIMTQYTKEYNEIFMNPMYLSIRDYKPCFKESPFDVIQYSSLGLKYILSEKQFSDYEYLELVDKVNEIYIYKNIYAETFTTFFDNVVLKSEFEKLGYIDRNKIQQKAMVINDEDAMNFTQRIKSAEEILNEYEFVDLTEKSSIEGQPVSSVLSKEIEKNIEITLEDNWYSSVKGTPIIEIKVSATAEDIINIKLDTGNGYNDNEKYRMKCNNGESEVQYVLPKDVKSIKIDCTNTSNAKLMEFKLIDSKEPIKIMDNPSVLYEGESNSKISGTISCDRDGVLYLPLVYSDNWEVIIDGKKTETYVANSGFIGVNILEGDHKIEIAYVSKEIKIGIACLVFALVVLCIYYISCIVYGKKKNLNNG